jgi:AraC-like DNA-binding protein
VLVDVRRYAAPELDALHEAVDVRVPFLRVSFYRSHNVAVDYALLQQASPFLHRLRRPQLAILLAGSGRFEEGGRRAWLRGGQVVAADESKGSTEAYAGADCACLCLSWDPAVLGAPIAGGFAVETLSGRDRSRLQGAAVRLGDARPADAMTEVLSILRSLGVPFAKLEAADLAAHSADADSSTLHAAVATTLSRLEQRPALEDLAATLGWNHRFVHRRLSTLAEAYSLPWRHWREALHQARLLHAMRLLSAPGATTELVARLTGFRAPAALCHAFAKASLPSPGTLARVARKDVLDAWSQFAATPPHMVRKEQSTARGTHLR